MASKRIGARMDGFLAAFASAAEAVDIHFRWRPQMADTDDEMFLEAAVNGKADASCTVTRGTEKMSKSAYPLNLPTSLKNAAAELAKMDGVSLNQFIVVAIAEKVAVLRTANEYLCERAGTAKPQDLLTYLRRVPKVVPVPGAVRQ